ncbi:MAG: hypothetical protein NUV87_00720 [Candidatus Roizmanbacteria bacterium]|nr:hypothetical protein [Candidatus Roizmanbacteria bacterium]
MNIQEIEAAIQEGKISYQDCLNIARTLKCYEGAAQAINPGTQIMTDLHNVDLADCTHERLEAGEKPLTSPRVMLDYFPNPRGEIPSQCFGCIVFKPAKKKLEALARK